MYPGSNAPGLTSKADEQTTSRDVHGPFVQTSCFHIHVLPPLVIPFLGAPSVTPMNPEAAPMAIAAPSEVLNADSLEPSPSHPLALVPPAVIDPQTTSALPTGPSSGAQTSTPIRGKPRKRGSHKSPGSPTRHSGRPRKPIEKLAVGLEPKTKRRRSTSESSATPGSSSMARQISTSSSVDSGAMSPIVDKDIQVSPALPAVAAPSISTLPPFVHSDLDIALGNTTTGTYYWHESSHILLPDPNSQITHLERLVFPPGSYCGPLWPGSQFSGEVHFLRMQSCVDGCTYVAEGKQVRTNRKHVLGCAKRAATFRGFADPIKRLLQLASVPRKPVVAPPPPSDSESDVTLDRPTSSSIDPRDALMHDAIIRDSFSGPSSAETLGTVKEDLEMTDDDLPSLATGPKPSSIVPHRVPKQYPPRVGPKSTSTKPQASRIIPGTSKTFVPPTGTLNPTSFANSSNVVRFNFPSNSNALPTATSAPRTRYDRIFYWQPLPAAPPTSRLAKRHQALTHGIFHCSFCANPLYPSKIVLPSTSLAEDRYVYDHLVFCRAIGSASAGLIKLWEEGYDLGDLGARWRREEEARKLREEETRIESSGWDEEDVQVEGREGMEREVAEIFAGVAKDVRGADALKIKRKLPDGSMEDGRVKVGKYGDSFESKTEVGGNYVEKSKGARTLEAKRKAQWKVKEANEAELKAKEAEDLRSKKMKRVARDLKSTNGTKQSSLFNFEVLVKGDPYCLPHVSILPRIPTLFSTPSILQPRSISHSSTPSTTYSSYTYLIPQSVYGKKIELSVELDSTLLDVPEDNRMELDEELGDCYFGIVVDAEGVRWEEAKQR